MKKELALLGSVAPLLASLGLAGVAIGGAAVLTLAIINTLNKKGMALTDKDLEAIGNLIDKKLDEKLQPINNRLDKIDERLGIISERQSAMGIKKQLNEELKNLVSSSHGKFSTYHSLLAYKKTKKGYKQIGQLDFVILLLNNNTPKLILVEVKTSFNFGKLRDSVNKYTKSNLKKYYYKLPDTNYMDLNSLLGELNSNIPNSQQEVIPEKIEVEYWNVFYIRNQVEDYAGALATLRKKNKINLRLFEIDSEHVRLQEIKIPED